LVYSLGLNNLKVLFIFPGPGGFDLAPKLRISTGAFLPPLGLLYLAKILELQGHAVRVMDCNAEGFNDDIFRMAIQSSDAVGMTIYSGPINLENSLFFAKKIRQYRPDIPFLIGGPHCTIVPEDALRDHDADIAVCGEAEYRIGPIIDALEEKGSLSSVPGIFYRENDTIRRTKEHQQIIDLDPIPFPSRHLVDKNIYGHIYGTKLIKGKVASLIGSRGCPYRCTFCQVSSFLPQYRGRSAQNIIREVDEIVSADYNAIAFVDENFIVDKKKIERIMDHIIHEQYDLTLWVMDTRVDTAERRLYEKMRDAGVTNIFFGIESGNQEVLDYYNKKFTLTQVRDAVELSKEMGFLVGGNFIIGAPIETKRHIQDTIAFAKSLPLDTVIFNHFAYLKGAAIWHEAVQQGKINPDEFLVVSDSKRGLAHFTAKEIDDFSMRAYRNFFFNPHYWFREISYSISHGNFSILNLGLRMLHLK
jgi:anaerobic magnesium-protoporphyrin IX monomethyl ester cyclase